MINFYSKKHSKIKMNKIRELRKYKNHELFFQKLRTISEKWARSRKVFLIRLRLTRMIKAGKNEFPDPRRTIIRTNWLRNRRVRPKTRKNGLHLFKII